MSQLDAFGARRLLEVTESGVSDAVVATDLADQAQNLSVLIDRWTRHFCTGCSLGVTFLKVHFGNQFIPCQREPVKKLE